MAVQNTIADIDLGSDSDVDSWGADGNVHGDGNSHANEDAGIPGQAIADSDIHQGEWHRRGDTLRWTSLPDAEAGPSSDTTRMSKP